MYTYVVNGHLIQMCAAVHEDTEELKTRKTAKVSYILYVMSPVL